MQPTSFSATALNTFQLCPSRYNAEAVQRSKGFGSDAANLGTSVHGGLELYVKAVYLEKTEQPNEKLLLDFYKMSYAVTFNTSDYDTVEYMEGYEMMKQWYLRSGGHFDGRTVVSCEIKDNFPVPTSIGEIPFNYIWDRFDQTDEREFTVVDYKSNRWDIKASDLKKKVQPRAYALACAIQLKSQGIECDRIWVEFDMLRHGGTRGTVFTREDNAATWKFIKESGQKIVDTPEEEIPERLNGECLFCVRKASCNALKKNIHVGGIHSIPSIEDAIDLRAGLEWQKKGLESLITDLDKKILTEARERDIEEYESDTTRLFVTVSNTRAVDGEMVEMAVGSDVFKKYGSASISMANIDKLLKGSEITDEQKKQLRGLIYKKTGSPRVKVEAKNPIDED